MRAKLREVMFTPSAAGGWGEWFMGCVVAGVIGVILVCLIVVMARAPGFGREMLNVLAYLTVVIALGMVIATGIRALYLRSKAAK